MTPVIRIDKEVMDELKKRAIDLGLVFEPPNATLRGVLGLEVKRPVYRTVENTAKQVVENEIEVKLTAGARKYVLIPLPRNRRAFFPGFMKTFELITDVGVLPAHVTSAPRGTPVGDPDSGGHIRARLGTWYRRHPELEAGDRLRIQALEPGKRYKLSIVDRVIDSSKEKVTLSPETQALVDKAVKEALEQFKSNS